MFIALLFFAALLTAVGLYSMASGMVASAPVRTSLSERLDGNDADIDSLRDQELSRPFVVRVVDPMFQALGAGVFKRLPAARNLETDRQIIAAGGLWGLNASEYYASRVILTVVFGTVGFLLAGALGLDSPLNLLLTGAGVLVGYISLRVALLRRIRRRQTRMRKALPSVLDLLCIGVEAGLAIDVALAQVAEKFNSPLGREIGATLDEIRLGRTRIEALQAMAERVGLEELDVFVDAVAQSIQLGTSLSRTLRIQAEEMRRKRRQRAEELGAKAPLKMLFPMIGCIFPTLFVVILGPAALVLIEQLNGKGS